MAQTPSFSSYQVLGVSIDFDGGTLYSDVDDSTLTRSEFEMAIGEADDVFMRLYNVDGQGAYPVENTGLFDMTGERRDMGRFKAPTLRNIAVTAPYMHDGSVGTLEEVVRNYARGGRLIDAGEFAGDGKLSPFKSEFIRGFELSDEELADLIAFLESLTDQTVLTAERWSDPHGQ